MSGSYHWEAASQNNISSGQWVGFAFGLVSGEEDLFRPKLLYRGGTESCGVGGKDDEIGLFANFEGAEVFFEEGGVGAAQAIGVEGFFEGEFFVGGPFMAADGAAEGFKGAELFDGAVGRKGDGDAGVLHGFERIGVA